MKQELEEQISMEVDRATKKFGDQQDIPSISPEASRRSDDRRAALYMMPSEHMAKATTDQRMKDKKLSWADIAVEELAEVIGAKNDAERRDDLIQLAAVCIRWISKIDADIKKAKEEEDKLKRK